MSKTLIVLVGASGAGKSSWSQGREHSGAAVICSADDGMIEADGVYRFAASKLASAHGACQYKAQMAMASGKPLVVIDNTSTTTGEIFPYLSMGQRFGYEVEILVFRAVQDPEVLAARNRHGVPIEVIRTQLEKISYMLKTWPDSWPQYRVADLASVRRSA